MSKLISETPLNDGSGLTTYVYSNGVSVTQEPFTTFEPTTEEIEDIARSWRDMELGGCDYIVPLTDHPQHAAYMTYRAALRDWPATSDFPDTKPTLGE